MGSKKSLKIEESFQRHLHWLNYEVMELGTSEVSLRIKQKDEDASNSMNKVFTDFVSNWREKKERKDSGSIMVLSLGLGK